MQIKLLFLSKKIFDCRVINHHLNSLLFSNAVITIHYVWCVPSLSHITQSAVFFSVTYFLRFSCISFFEGLIVLTNWAMLKEPMAT